MLAVITNYYNPNNDQRRLKNYKLFLEKMNDLNLYTLELNQNTSINKNKNISIKNNSINCIWQQYRLINILIEKLPEKYNSVAWIDCDIVFEDENWVEKTEKSLEKYLFVQTFEKAHFLNEENEIIETRNSCGSLYCKTGHPFSKTSWSGFAWAANLDFIKKWKIYDYWMWSSDLSLVIALLGLFEDNFLKIINSKMKEHYLKWAIPFNKEAKKSFGFVETEIKHLWHGDVKKRRAKERLKILKDFDPENDIKINENKCFEWCSNNLKLHKKMTNVCLERESYRKLL